MAAASTAADGNRDGNVAEAPFTPNSRSRSGETPGHELKRRRIEDGAVDSVHAREGTGDVGSRENQGEQVFCVVDVDEFDAAQRIWKRFAKDMDRRRGEWELLNSQLKTVIDTLCRLNDLDTAFARQLATLHPRAYGELTFSELESPDVEIPISSSFQRGATTPSAGGGAAAAGPAVPPAENNHVLPWPAGALLLNFRLRAKISEFLDTVIPEIE